MSMVNLKIKLSYCKAIAIAIAMLAVSSSLIVKTRAIYNSAGKTVTVA